MLYGPEPDSPHIMRINLFTVRMLHMDIKREKIAWEKRFPASDETWTHWWIEGNGELIAVLKGSMLLKALDIVEEDFEAFVSIKAYRVRVELDGQIIPDKKRSWEVAHNWDLARKRRGKEEIPDPNLPLHKDRS